VLIATFLGNDSGNVALLAGWTSVFSVTSGWTKRRQMFWKAASGEPASYAWTSGANACCGIIVCVSGTTGVKDADANQTNTSSTTVAGPAFTTANGDETIMWAGFRNTVASNPTVGQPTSLTVRATVYAGPDNLNPAMWVATGQFASAGALTGTYRDGSIQEATANMAAIIAFVPALPVSGPLMFCEA
jgi:hypothetical protein